MGGISTEGGVGNFIASKSRTHNYEDQAKQRNDESSDFKKSPAFYHSPSPLTALNCSGERAISSTLYAGGRSNGSPSPEADADLDEALMLALLALKAADSCEEMFVVRMLKDRPTPRSAGDRAGGGNATNVGSCALALAE